MIYQDEEGFDTMGMTSTLHLASPFGVPTLHTATNTSEHLYHPQTMSERPLKTSFELLDNRSAKRTKSSTVIQYKKIRKRLAALHHAPTGNYH